MIFLALLHSDGIVCISDMGPTKTFGGTEEF